MRHARNRREWSPAELDDLRRNWGIDSLNTIARRLGRGKWSLMERAIDLGLADNYGEEEPSRFEPTEADLGPQVRRALAALRPLKRAYGEQQIPIPVLDRVLEPIDCARGRRLRRDA